jgi:hypothetical protein
MKTHFLTLLLAVFLAFGTASFAKAEEASDVPPEQIETLDTVESGETDETTDPVEAERYFVGGWWTYGGDLGIIDGGDEQCAAEGEEVFFYATPEEGYVCSLIKVSNGYVGDDGAVYAFDDSELAFTDHGDGTYSFIMPGNPVQVYVEFSNGQEHNWDDPEGYFAGRVCDSRGSIEFLKDAMYYEEGEEVFFYITTEDDVTINEIVVENSRELEDGSVEPIENSFVEFTAHEDGTYSFIMPGNPVQIFVDFSDGQEHIWEGEKGHFICRSWTNGGTLEFVDDTQEYAEAGEEVFFRISVEEGFSLGIIRVFNGYEDEEGYISPLEDSELEYIDYGDGTYSFIMPDNPVYLYVEFFDETVVLPDGYFVGNSVQFGDFEFVNDIDWFAVEGAEVIFRINTYEGYALDRVDVLNCVETAEGIIEPIEGSLTEVTANADGTYSFIMPANPVIISAVFTEAEIGNFIGRCPQEGGNLEFVNDDQWFATEGETVSFRAVADQGYELDRVEVMNCRELEDGSVEAIDGSYVTVTKNADGTYSFFMPDNAVQVFAFFKEKATAPICNPTWPTFGFGWNWGWNSMNHLYGMVQNAWNAFYNCYRYPAHMGWMGRSCGWGLFF